MEAMGRIGVPSTWPRSMIAQDLHAEASNDGDRLLVAGTYANRPSGKGRFHRGVVELVLLNVYCEVIGSQANTLRPRPYLESGKHVCEVPVGLKGMAIVRIVGRVLNEGIQVEVD